LKERMREEQLKKRRKRRRSRMYPSDGDGIAQPSAHQRRAAKSSEDNRFRISAHEPILLHKACVAAPS